MAVPGPFYKLDATGYPVHSEWSVFRPKFLSYLGAAQLFEEDELEIIRAALLQPESDIGAGWKNGGPADRLLWNEFVNVGAEGIPQTLQELLPQDEVDKEWGLTLVQEVFLLSPTSLWRPR